MKARILNIGDEVLNGWVDNQNSFFLAKELKELSITLEEIKVIGDNKEHITDEVKRFLNSDIDILITTGGLGPTHDDFTKEVVCELLGLEMYYSKEILKNFKKHFPQGIPETNKKVLCAPKGAMLLKNENGTAYGNLINYQDKIIILLVGPPGEMNPMFLNYAKPYLKKRTEQVTVFDTLLIGGIKESQLEENLKSFYEKYPNITLAPYANYGIINYKLESYISEEKMLKEAISDLIDILGPYYIGSGTQTLEEHLVGKLKQQKKTISFAESCTGGLAASKIINVSGCSDIFNESLVTYSNQAKMKYLRVEQNTLSKFGAVSEEVVKEMVYGLKRLSGSDINVAISGIAGPSGGSRKKPVGLVHFAILIDNEIYYDERIFTGNRQMVREKATNYILWKIYSLL